MVGLVGADLALDVNRPEAHLVRVRGRVRVRVRVGVGVGVRGRG